MYSVIRFAADAATSQLLKRLGAELNMIVPGAFKRLRPDGDGFSCAVARDDGWQEHRAAILGFIQAARPVILASLDEGIHVSVDVAIEPEDLTERAYFSVPVGLELGRVLADAGVSLELTVYPT